MTQKRVHQNFENLVNGLRSKIARDMGVDITFMEATKLVTKMLDNVDINFNINQIPKSKMREIKMKVKRRK